MEKKVVIADTEILFNPNDKNETIDLKQGNDLLCFWSHELPALIAALTEIMEEVKGE